jgi:hypothetical protein
LERTGTIAPTNLNDVYAILPTWLDLNVMVPFLATIIVVAVGILVICVAFAKRRGDASRGTSKDVYCMSYRLDIALIITLFFS